MAFWRRPASDPSLPEGFVSPGPGQPRNSSRTSRGHTACSPRSRALAYSAELQSSEVFQAQGVFVPHEFVTVLFTAVIAGGGDSSGTVLRGWRPRLPWNCAAAPSLRWATEFRLSWRSPIAIISAVWTRSSWHSSTLLSTYNLACTRWFNVTTFIGGHFP